MAVLKPMLKLALLPLLLLLILAQWVGTSYTKISSVLMISSARLRMLFILRTHSS